MTVSGKRQGKGYRYGQNRESFLMGDKFKVNFLGEELCHSECQFES